MVRYYNIQVYEKDKLFVTILASEMTSVYWRQLSDSLVKMHAENKHVYFDFMMRNGLHDRFYETQTDSHSLLSRPLVRFQAEPSLVNFANMFFSEQRKYLEMSALTSAQKSEFLHYL